MKSLTILLALLMVFPFVSAQGTITYISHDGTLSFEHPEDWVVDGYRDYYSLSSTDDYYFSMSLYNTTMANILFETTELSPDLSMEEVAAFFAAYCFCHLFADFSNPE